jgi:dTDP-4-amino-4,6-dideoxygalactose transaminase
MKVPFNDLGAQHFAIKEEINSTIQSVIESSAFVRGPYVEKFEDDFAKKIGTKYCVSCANGTDAIFIAMKALGIKPGDEVIAPAHSWISTTSTITQAGGKVIFSDTDNSTYTIDPNAIEDKITSKTVGIIPVHLYGQPADMEPIMKLAKKYNLWIIEDCAQAHLAEYHGQQVGTFGDMATYSFYPGKNLGAMGDAGAIVTNDKLLSDKAATVARHGGLTKGQHLIEGINSRMDGMQAGILSVKLKYLSEWTNQRRHVANIYQNLLKNNDVINLPIEAEKRRHSYHLYVIQCSQREQLALKLKEAGIGTVINYPIALPFLEAYKRFNHKPEHFKNAYSNQSKILSIPIFPGMTNDQISYVSEVISNFSKDIDL